MLSWTWRTWLSAVVASGVFASAPSSAQTLSGIAPTSVAADGSTEVSIAGTGFADGATQVLIERCPLWLSWS